MAAVSSSLPGLVGKLMGSKNSSVNQIAGLLSQRYNTPELGGSGAGGGTSDIGEISAQISQQYESFTPEEKEFYKNSCPQMEIIKNPLAQNMLGMGKDKNGGRPGRKNAASDKSGFTPVGDASAGEPAAPPAKTTFLNEWQRRIQGMAMMVKFNHADTVKKVEKYLWFFPAVLLGISLIAKFLDCPGCASFSARLVYKSFAWYLALLSLGCVFVQIVVEVNLMGLIPRTFWDAPVAGVLFSAFILRILDMNFPFWNRTLIVFSMPLTASVVTFGWGYIINTAKQVM